MVEVNVQEMHGKARHGQSPVRTRVVLAANGQSPMSTPDSNWPLPPSPAPELSRNTVHVWSASLEVNAAGLESLRQTLSKSERERAERFHFERHRRRFIAARAALRNLLGRYLQADPRALDFEYGPFGKPALAGIERGSGLGFNLSHCEDLALIAVTREPSVGVDVERVRTLEDFDELVARFFSKRESMLFKTVPAASKPTAFFNLWTRKEAWLKATGEGIGSSLSQVEVSFLPGERAELLDLPKALGRAQEWELRELQPAKGFAAALAVKAQVSAIQCWRSDFPTTPPERSAE